jgi:hypothetical protein
MPDGGILHHHHHFLGCVPTVGTSRLRLRTAAGNDGGVTDAAMLVLVDDAIAAILSGGAVKSWSEGGHSVSHLSLKELYGLKQQLETRIAQAAGGMLCLPIREVDV